MDFPVSNYDVLFYKSICSRITIKIYGGIGEEIKFTATKMADWTPKTPDTVL